MKPFIAIITMMSLIQSYPCLSQVKPVKTPVYPVTKKVEQVDNYFGTKVADPYRWLEDDNSQETAEWVLQQNEVTQNYLSQIPVRDLIKERLTEAWNFARMTTPVKVKGKEFFMFNSGLQNQSVLIMRDLDKNKETVVVDPNALATDGSISISQFEASNDGKYLAYALSKSGSDWNEIYVYDLKKKKLLSDEIKWVKFSNISWKGKGFYYSRYDQPDRRTEKTKANEYHKVYYHEVGSSQSKDDLIYENKEYPQRNYIAQVSDDERFLFIYEQESTSGNALYYKDLKSSDAPFVPLFKGFQYTYEVIGNFGDSILVRTDEGAARYRLILKDVKDTDREIYRVFIEEDDQNLLESAHLAKDYLIVKYLNMASSLILMYDRNGELTDKIASPTLGTIGTIHSKMDDAEFYYSLTSFTFPVRIYKYNKEMRTSRLMFDPKTVFSPSDYEIKQVTYKSFDETEVTMFVVHKKGIILNGSNPALLYGYGGFNESMTPFFSVSNMVFLENGGVLAVPNLRGGGEYGEAWHQGGIKEKKQNVFNDFIAAARYLINNSYTSSEKLAIAGGSNGGLLVGACMTQEPSLFKVALPAVGVMDMLRYQKFTIGWAWKSDYGSSDEETDFKYLYKYSPLHNIKNGVSYPATLVTTADHDDRVVPAHSFKFIATLQEKNKGNNPQLIRIQTKAGHGAGKSTQVRIDELSDVWAFTFQNLGMELVVKPSAKETAPQKGKPAYINDPLYKQVKPQKPVVKDEVKLKTDSIK